MLTGPAPVYERYQTSPVDGSMPAVSSFAPGNMPGPYTRYSPPPPLTPQPPPSIVEHTYQSLLDVDTEKSLQGRFIAVHFL